jgi:hypothetical protein
MFPNNNANEAYGVVPASYPAGWWTVTAHGVLRLFRGLRERLTARWVVGCRPGCGWNLEWRNLRHREAI